MDFIMLPDHPAAVAVATRVAGDRARILRHESGRPWIVGRWGDGEVVTAAVGGRRVALLGRTSATDGTLTGWLRGTRSTDDLGARSLELPGCFHLIGSFDGRAYAQGTLAGAYRIYHAVVDGVTVAAGAPDRLIDLTGATLDERSLPLCLLGPYARPPYPVSERTLWRGVGKLPPGHGLHLDTTGGHRTARWWSAPQPTVPLADAADLLRERLLEAVAARADRAGGTGLSADLSGGMDSTSLCFAAARRDIPLTTVHVGSTDPSCQDSRWAARCRDDLPALTHLTVDPGRLPGLYAPPRQPAGPRPEGPLSMIHEAMIEFLAELAADAGSGRHLRGDGSDELFHRPLAATAALIRRHPVRHLRGLLRMKAHGRWSWRATVRNVRPPERYPRWLRRVARELDTRYDLTPRPQWDLALKLPRWVTPDAVATVRELYREVADRGDRPLVDDPAQNEVLRLVQLTGEAVRQSSHVGRRHQVTFEAPYVDDRVLHAALAVRMADRARAGVNKPVLAAAMRGVVPQDVLDRRDKSDGNRDMFASLRRNRHHLAQLCDEPELARLGLVDADVLRESTLGPHIDLMNVMPMGATWATERWLRTLPEARHFDTAVAPVPQYA
jgi:asparagine synthase (glutamine-hydrolysing)